METLASILAGSGANPYQTDPGVSQLISQLMFNQQMAPQQLGMPQQQQQQLGSMGATAPQGQQQPATQPAMPPPY